jgi:hypothetical protein
MKQKKNCLTKNVTVIENTVVTGIQLYQGAVFGDTGTLFRLNGRHDKKNTKRGDSLYGHFDYLCFMASSWSNLRSSTIMKKLLW